MEAVYSLPFDTSKNPVRISQGNNGPWSHFVLRRKVPAFPGKFTEIDLSNAVDFALPLGAEVRAARDGVVFMFSLNNDWVYKGLNPKEGNSTLGLTNFIQIAHSDGTIALYSHLEKQVLARRGHSVTAGEVIALTGESGWIAEVPHLHFQVNDSNQRGTIQIAFQDYSGSLDHETLQKEGRIWFGERMGLGGETE